MITDELIVQLIGAFYVGLADELPTGPRWGIEFLQVGWQLVAPDDVGLDERCRRVAVRSRADRTGASMDGLTPAPAEGLSC